MNLCDYAIENSNTYLANRILAATFFLRGLMNGEIAKSAKKAKRQLKPVLMKSFGVDCNR